MLQLSIIIGLLSVGLGIFLTLKYPTLHILDRLLIAALPIGISVAIAALSKEILNAPFWDWDAARLTPTFAITQGYQLYYGSNSGPALNTVYGPITALSYLPTTLAQSPTSAVLAGAVISALFFFLPILALTLTEHRISKRHSSHLSHSQRRLGQVYSLYLLLGFLLFIHRSTPLNYSAFNIHSDAIALGLGGTSCWFLYLRHLDKRGYMLAGSAIAMVLAVWAKQSTVPILVALPTYLFLVEGRRVLIRYLACIGLAVLGISSVLLLIFNPENMFFNIVTLLKEHAWRAPDILSDADVIALALNGETIPENKLQALINVGQDLFLACIVPWILLGFAYISLHRRFSNVPKTLSEWLKANRWSLFLWVSLFMLPMSLLGRVKIGGSINAFSFTLYYLVTAELLLVMQLVGSPRGNSLRRTSRIPSKFLAVFLGIAFFIRIFPTGALKQLPTLISNLPNNPQQIAYNYAKKHPGETYFPWNPLSTLMAEGEVYHFEYALVDRLLGGYPVSMRNFKAHTPKSLKFVAFSGRNDEYALQFLPEFSQRVEIEELPGWTVYSRP